MKHLKKFNEEIDAKRWQNDLSEDQLWELIEMAEWTKDHDFKRISKMYKKLPKNEFRQLKKFYDNKLRELDKRFRQAWLGNPGIDVSDDGWWDLRAEVIGRGREFYNSITVQKLRRMANRLDYQENFGYSFQSFK